MNSAIQIIDRLGVSYERVLVSVDLPGSGAVARQTGQPVPLQSAPATPFDPAGSGDVQLALIDLDAHATLTLESADRTEPTTIRIERDELNRRIVINGEVSLRLPADGFAVQPFPGPVAGVRLGAGEWLGESRLVDAPFAGHVQTDIESIGSAFVQWRTTYRWASGGGVTIHARWASGSDTVEFVEEISEDSDAAIEFTPLWPGKASSHIRGGGEGLGPMQPLRAMDIAGASKLPGRRLLGRVSHIAYWNQWNLSWVGFVDASSEVLVGIFSMRGAEWRGRGHVRIDVIEDDDRGHLLRSPIRSGRRFWGLTVTTRAASRMDSKEHRALLNRRKTQRSDLRLDKVRHWVLDLPLEPREVRLVRAEDLAAIPAKISQDPKARAAFSDLLRRTDEQPQHPCRFAAAWATQDRPQLARHAGALVSHMRTVMSSIADGGYERLIIFDGRYTKPLAFDLDAMWAENLIDEKQYRELRSALLAIAYMFVDADYCNFTDFWPDTEPHTEHIFQALRDDMGDCPVPPNFAAEFFSTTAVVAELCPNHPQTSAWRTLTLELLKKFGEVYFAADGTYLESINYHQHCFNEMLMQMWVQKLAGGPDAFAWPWVKGSFQHWVDVQMPTLSHVLPAWQKSTGNTYLADSGQPVTPFLNNGNSGSEWNQQMYTAELIIGAWAYEKTDPKLAAELMQIFQESGRPILDYVHPLMTLAAYHPAAPTAAPVWRSAHRHTLGLVGKATRPDGRRVYAFFRAGRATHHMDFDQGHVSLALGDRMLLGDPGYHVHDSDGRNVPAASTHVHNTIVYSQDPWLSSGYSGLEEAPTEAKIHLSDAFDYSAIRIVNSNSRNLNEHPYNRLLPAPLTIHTRHFLFIKPDYIVLWDTFEKGPNPSTFFLHTHEPLRQIDGGNFRAGEPGKPHLLVRFLEPAEIKVVENRAFGSAFSFAIRGAAGAGFLTLLVPQVEDRPMETRYDAPTRTLRVQRDGRADQIVLPASPGQLPLVRRT